MKIESFILMLLLSCGLDSCKSISTLYYHTNESRKFNSREEYLNILFDSEKFQKDKIIFITDSNYDSLIKDIVEKQLSTYYGIVNENSFVFADQLTVKSCQGLITKLYRKFENNDETIVIKNPDTIALLKSMSLDLSKQTLLFMYSYKLGRLSKTQIKSVIKELQSSEKFDYRIIVLDNNDISQ